MNTIYHITQHQKWSNAVSTGTYQSDSLDSEGFIHCSTIAQLVGSANRFFSGQKDLVILVIDSDLVQPEIRYEGVESHNLFPHIYGALNVNAVLEIIHFTANSDNSFSLPPELTH